MNTDWSILWGEPGLAILGGLRMTLQLAAWSLALAVSIGFVFGTIRWIGLRIAEPFCWFYVELARNTPPVVQILFWYFSASYILPTPAFMVLRDIGYEFGAAIIALGIYHGAFFAEVVRAGLNSVPLGQFEAARALGLNFVQALRKVLYPQAIRIIIPPLLNETTSLVKNTSLAMAIGVAELTYQYRAIDNFLFRGVEALTAVTVIYLILCLLMVGMGHLINARLSRHVTARSIPASLRSETA